MLSNIMNVIIADDVVCDEMMRHGASCGCVMYAGVVNALSQTLQYGANRLYPLR
jgi:hypothetical protein